MSKGRILVTGASGQVGWHLCRYLTAQGYRVTGTYHANQPVIPGVELRPLDLSNPPGLSDFAGYDYFAVIHAAALTSVDRCEKTPDLARRVNSEATRLLAGLFHPETRFIYFSTDLVFDGERGGYRESDPINPVNVYAGTKAGGEQAVLARPGGVVVRLALSYGFATPFSSGFTAVMKDCLDAGKPVRLFVDQFRTPVYVGDIVRAIERLITQQPQHQVYHLGGAERVSRWEFGCRFADVFGYDRALLLPTKAAESGLVVRGKDCSLDCSRFANEFFQTCEVLEGLRRMQQGVY